MGTVVDLNGIRIWINSKESQHKGRPHCHVEGRGGEAVVDLRSHEALHVTGYSPRDMRQIIVLIKSFQDELDEEWEKFHG